MRILQTYEWFFFKTFLRGFLLLDSLSLDYNDLKFLKEHFLKLGFFLYPVRLQIIARFYSQDIINFFKNFKSSQLKTFFLLVPHKKCEENTLNNFFDLCIKKDKFSYTPFFFYNNFFINDTRQFVIKTSSLYFYKDFYLKVITKIQNILFLSGFFVKLFFLFICFKFFLKKTNLIKF